MRVCHAPARPSNDARAGLQLRKLSGSFVMATFLSANSTGEKMRIDLANTIDIRPNFGMYLDLGKAPQNLKHQFRVDRLIDIGPKTFADHQPAIARQSRARLIQAKQKILGDMQHVDGVHEIELARGDALSVPRQIEVERAPF